MTWNIRTGVGNDPDRDGGRTDPDLQRIARVIRSIRPDIVAIQEIDRERDRTAFVDQPTVLGAALEMNMVFAPNLVDPAGQYGIATFTPHPITWSEHVRYPGAGTLEPRGLLEVVIETGAGPIRVLNTHLQVGEDEEARLQRDDAAQSLALRMRGAAEPFVVMGDFNADPSAPELQPLSGALDAWAEKGSGDGCTIPASPFRDATARIDAIFADPRFLVRECAVIRTAETLLASDHFPVVADLVLVADADLSATR